MPKLVRYSDACEALSVSRRTLYRMIDAGQLNPVNIRPDNARPTWRIDEAEVQRIAARTQTATQS